MADQIGFKIKSARRRLNISQANLSEKIGISPSYLNLIESGKRKLSLDVLLKISEILNLDIKDLSKKDNVNLAYDLQDLLGDNLFEDLDITNIEVKDLSETNPLIAKALIRLGDVYRKKNSETFDKVEVLSGENLQNLKSTFPGEVVSDFLQEHQNYFPKLEDFASRIFENVHRDFRTRYVLLSDYLKKKHNVSIIDVVPEKDQMFSKKYSNEKKILYLSNYVTLETKKLYCAAQIAQFEAMSIIEEYLSDYNFPSDISKKLTTISLLNYTAAAILMPYKLFFDECKKYRYDMELLQHTFAVSFEQVAHRVTCLQDPKMKGIPFHMLRSDIAGNISKRLSLSGIQIPRYGGACPRWNIYSAFMSPGKIHSAISKMPDGEKYVCIARTVEKGIGGYGMYKSILSIGLGCEIKYAKDFVYSDSLNLKDENAAIPIGVNCRTCPRMECQQRAFPPVNKDLSINLNKRGISVYVGD
ncbi:MAG: helix-turn-helix domain-containing protein [Pelagibacterales bacterium]|jgi:predicted transcriptional regulator/DNA-binding XRE family transcriptional regulator|nr:helix-turn-helix domain-containing protein [Pelagibacterales bacterium]